MLILPYRFKGQPQYPAPISKSGLGGKARFVLLGNQPYELVNKAPRTGTIGTTDYTSDGVAYLPPSTATTWAQTVPDLDPYTSGSFTVFWHGVLRADTAQTLLRDLGPVYGWEFKTNTWAPGALRLMLLGFWSGGGPVKVISVTDNTLHSLAIRYDDAAATVEFFLDGISQGSGSFTKDIGAVGSGTFGMVGDATSPHKMHTVQAFSGKLSDAEIWVLHESKGLALFKTLARRVWVASASGNNYTLAASSGSFAISGTAAALKYNRVLPALSGSFAATGTAATLKRGYALQAASGSVSVSGTAAALKLARVLQAGSGSVDVTGTDATLSISSNKTLQADSGSFAVSGSAATLKISRVLPTSSGSVQIGGVAAGLKYNRLLSVAPGSFAISGTDATLIYQTAGNRTLVADAGSFAISGGAASLRIGRKLSAAPGSFAFTGTAATLRYARKVIAEAGAFAITGTAAALSKSGGAVSASRTYAVPVEERIFAIQAENRTLTVKL